MRQYVWKQIPKIWCVSVDIISNRTGSLAGRRGRTGSHLTHKLDTIFINIMINFTNLLYVTVAVLFIIAQTSSEGLETTGFKLTDPLNLSHSTTSFASFPCPAPGTPSASARSSPPPGRAFRGSSTSWKSPGTTYRKYGRSS